MINKLKALIVKALNEVGYHLCSLAYSIDNATFAENVALIILASLPVAAGWVIAMY